MIGDTISDYPDSKRLPVRQAGRDANPAKGSGAHKTRKRRRILHKLPMIILQNATPLRHIDGVGMRILHKDRDLKLNSLSRFEPSPKGIDISTEGIALGLDLTGIITTLKGLNT